MRHLLRCVSLAALLAPAGAAAQIVGSLEFSAGFAGTAASDASGAKDADLNTTWGITPAVESLLGKNVALGAEWNFAWVQVEGKNPAGDEFERHLTMTPAARIRMSFPVYDKVTFDGMLALGLGIWTEPDGTDQGTRFGYGLRFNFGGSYQFNDAVAAFANVGYQRSTTYGDDRELTYDWVPFNVGLRSAF